MGLVSDGKIRLSPKQTQAWGYLTDNRYRRIFFGGGAGSTKTTTGCLWHIDQRVRYAGTRGFIGRNTYQELRDSTQASFFEVLADMSYRPGADYRYNAQDEIIHWANGSETHFRYMAYKPSDPDFHRFGSTEYTDAFVDEGPGVDERAVQVLESRLRYKHVEYNLTPKMLITGNPGPHWVRDRFVCSSDGTPTEVPRDVAVVLTTIKDHPDRAYRERYMEQLERLDPYTKARLLYGDWLASPKTGREFFHAFDAQKHVKPATYDPSKPLHIGLDFNRAPYMTLIASQVRKERVGLVEKYVVHGLREYCLEHPYNTTEAVCKSFLQDTIDGLFAGHASGVYVYGDYSGKTAKTSTVGGIEHDYDVVWSVLSRHLSGPSDRVIPNPPHRRVSKWVNDSFSGRTAVEFYFDTSMSNSIRDFASLKEDPDGSILKEKIRDKVTGKTMEKGGHCAQANYYIWTSLFHDNFEGHR